jgi:hypothetical protein
MKTIREMMDQLDEISRRDVLKGAGAAAVAGATGYELGKRSSPDTIPKNPQIYYIVGRLLTSLPPGSKMRGEMFKLKDRLAVEVDSLPDNQSKPLDSAYLKGANEGYERLKYLVRAYGHDELKVDWTRDKNVIELLEKEALPYYEKLQMLLKQPVQEASPDALSKIDELYKS